MRLNISLLFYISASCLILGHIYQNMTEISQMSLQNKPYYQVFSNEKRLPKSGAKIDYKRLAELNEASSKAEGW